MRYTKIAIIFLILFIGCKEVHRVDITPAKESKVFLPEIVSKSYNVRDAALSADGKEFYYTATNRHRTFIFVVKRNGEVWGDPKVVSFSGKYNDIEPFISEDGNRLYFASDRPLEEKGEKKDYDIWYSDREGNKWGKPVNLGAPVNTPKNEFYPSVTRKGKIYWCAIYDSISTGGEDIYYSELVDGKYTFPKNVGENVNTKSDEYNAFVGHDDSYIILTSHGWGKGVGSGDLWISFKRSGKWSKPQNMGGDINTKYFEYCPQVSYDGKYLFYTSNRISESKLEENMDFEKADKWFTDHDNGSSNIYFSSTRIIDSLRNEAVYEE